MKSEPDIIGKTKSEAETILAEHRLVLRVSQEDGKWLWGTCEYRPERINVVIEKGIVIAIHGVG